MERPGIKYYFTLKMMYHKTVDTTILSDPPPLFPTEVFSALDMTKFGDHVKFAMQQLQQQMENFQRNGSGWIIDHFIHLDIGNTFSLELIFFMLCFIICFTYELFDYFYRNCSLRSITCIILHSIAKED